MTASEACAAGLICCYCWRALPPDGTCCCKWQREEAVGRATVASCGASDDGWRATRGVEQGAVEPQASQAQQSESPARGDDGIPKEFRNCQRAPQWTCRQCSRSNWRTRLVCQRCEQPHPAQASHLGDLVEEALRWQEQEHATSESTSGNCTWQNRSSGHPAARRVRGKSASSGQGGPTQWTRQEWTPKQWKEWRWQCKETASARPGARWPGSGPKGA